MSIVSVHSTSNLDEGGEGLEGFQVMAQQTGPFSFDFDTNEDSEHTNHWDFGDGSLVEAPVGETIPHDYTEPGNYTVEVTCHQYTGTCYVVAGEGGEATIYRVAVIINDLDVTIQVIVGVPGRHIDWHWGDGQSSEVTLDEGGHGAVSHTYAVAGTYDVESRDADTNEVLRRRRLVVPTNFDTGRIITYGHFNKNYEFLLFNGDWTPVVGEQLTWYFGDGAFAEPSDSSIAVMHTYSAYGPVQVTCVFGGNAEHLLLDIVPSEP